VSNSRWNAIFHCWKKPFDDCIQELHWPTIQQRHDFYSICHMHDNLHHRNSLPLNELYQLSGTSTRSHSLSICLVTSTISYFTSFFLLCKQPIPFELYTIYHLVVKEVNCVLLSLAPLPFLISICRLCLIFLLLFCFFIMLYLYNLYVLIYEGEYVLQTFSSVILTKLIIILIIIVGKYCK